LRREPRSQPALTVGLSLVKGERTDWAVAKLVELGIDRIALFMSERTVVRTGETGSGRTTRLRRIARESAAQSRQLFLPEVSATVRFDSLLASLDGPRVAVAEPGGGPVTLERPTILVGPEGGWSASELEMATGRAVAQVDLGGGVLRAETAAVASGVLLAALRAGTVLGAGAGAARRDEPVR
jgi:16S rRNA (uracil1498-N3)-methyltransferase